MTYGDYKLINEVFIDNFEEADSLMGPYSAPTTTNVPATLEVSVVAEDSNTQKLGEASSQNSSKALDKIASWNFTLKRLEIELFLGTNDPVGSCYYFIADVCFYAIVNVVVKFQFCDILVEIKHRKCAYQSVP